MATDILDFPVARNQPDTGRDYISFSAIRLYQSCPLKYFCKYRLGLPEDTVSAALVYGSASHSLRSRVPQPPVARHVNAAQQNGCSTNSNGWAIISSRTEYPTNIQEKSRQHHVSSICTLAPQSRQRLREGRLRKPLNTSLRIAPEMPATAAAGQNDIVGTSDKPYFLAVAMRDRGAFERVVAAFLQIELLNKRDLSHDSLEIVFAEILDGGNFLYRLSIAA